MDYRAVRDRPPAMTLPSATHLIVKPRKETLMFRRRLRSAINRVMLPSVIEGVRQQSRTSPETKVAQRFLYHYYRSLVATNSLPSLQETGFRVFSQFEEDGKLLFIFAAMGISMSMEGGQCDDCRPEPSGEGVTCASACAVPAVGVTVLPAGFMKPVFNVAPGPAITRSLTG